MEGILQLISHFPMAKAKPAEEVNPAREKILRELKDTMLQLDVARSGFELETNFDLIDAYILQIDALEKRYSYWLKQAKREKIAAF